MINQEKTEKFAKIISITALIMLIVSSLYTIFKIRPDFGYKIENFIPKSK